MCQTPSAAGAAKQRTWSSAGSPYSPRPRYDGTHVEYNRFSDDDGSYTDRMFDSDTGLQNNLHRWYDPNSGRWISEDPIGFAAGDANLYRYMGNRVTSLTDPSGRNPYVDNSELSEEESLQILQDTLKEWDKSKWHLASAILRTFLGRKGKTDLEDEFDFSHLSSHVSGDKKLNDKIKRFLHNQVVANYRWNGERQKIRVPDGKKFDVRWNLGEGELFYAFGVARVHLLDTIITVEPHGFNECTYRARGVVKITDDYTFPSDGLHRIRTIFSAYAAADTLERMYGYKRFKTKVEFRFDINGAVKKG